MKIFNSDGGILPASVCTAYKGKIVCLDCGHSPQTAGKRSFILPDGRQLFEWEVNRAIAHIVKDSLQKAGIQCIITTEDTDRDPSLTERAERINKIVNQYGKDKVVAVSIHSDAYGTTWNDANGWTVYTSKGTTESDKMAAIFKEEAQKILPKYHKRVRGSKEEQFTILVKTKCPIVLVESLFYTNEEECKFLLSEEGRNVCATIIVNAIKRIAKCE